MYIFIRMKQYMYIIIASWHASNVERSRRIHIAGLVQDCNNSIANAGLRDTTTLQPQQNEAQYRRVHISSSILGR